LGNLRIFGTNISGKAYAQAAVVGSLRIVRDRTISELRTIPASGISGVLLWRTGDKDFSRPNLFETRKVISELGRKKSLFNISIEDDILYLGLITLENNERANHLDIHAPFNSGHKFTGDTEISKTGSARIMISATNSLIYSLGNKYQPAIFDGLIRIARFFVKNGLPPWTRMHPSMEFDLHRLTRSPYDPGPIITFSDLAHKALSDEILGNDGTATGS